tara:strand:+ start:471 stop:695 length:225 start_codon:yes stop_codon:yes gene_type:complete
MSNQKKPLKLLVFLFILLLTISLLFNFSLLKNLNARDSHLNNMYKYKKAYTKLTNVLGISPEQAKEFVDSTEGD